LNHRDTEGTEKDTEKNRKSEEGKEWGDEKRLMVGSDLFSFSVSSSCSL
jgi:hypothetical protein